MLRLWPVESMTVDIMLRKIFSGGDEPPKGSVTTIADQGKEIENGPQIHADSPGSDPDEQCQGVGLQHLPQDAHEWRTLLA